MKLNLITRIARSLLLARFKQTLIAAVGVTFSISMFIALLSFMAGLNDLLDGLLLNRTPHVRLYNEIQPNVHQPIYSRFDTNTTHNFIHSIKSAVSRQEIYNSQAIMQTLKKDQRVMGIAPKIISPVFFNDGAVDITGVVNGIEIQSEGKLFHFNEYVTAGNPVDIERLSNSIILGKGLADQLLANLGDVVQVATVNGERFPLRVVGFFQSACKSSTKPKATPP